MRRSCRPWAAQRVARGQAGLVTSPGVRLAAHQPGTPDARPLLPPPFQSSSGVCVFSSMARTAARTPRRSTRDLLRRFRQVEQEPPDRDHRNRAASGIDAFVLVPGHDGAATKVQFDHGLAQGRRLPFPRLLIESSLSSGLNWLWVFPDRRQTGNNCCQLRHLASRAIPARCCAGGVRQRGALPPRNRLKTTTRAALFWGSADPWRVPAIHGSRLHASQTSGEPVCESQTRRNCQVVTSE